MTKSHDHIAHIKNKCLDSVNNFRTFQILGPKSEDSPKPSDISRRQKRKYINFKNNNSKHGRDSIRKSTRICSDSNFYGVHCKHHSINHDKNGNTIRMTSKKKIIGNIIFISIGIFGLFILLQIVRKIIGGSWTKEDIILGLATVNIGLTFALGVGLGWPLMELRSDFKYLKTQFRSFVIDFRKTKDNVYDLKANVHNLKDDVYNLKDNIHILKESVLRMERKLRGNPKH